MRFLIDRCAGRKLAEWLKKCGHDVVEVWSLGPDPGDRQILEWAWAHGRIPVTIDTDFGGLVFAGGAGQSGIVRLPDIPAQKRIQLMEVVLNRYAGALEDGAIVTVRGEKIRVTRPPRLPAS
jgi:predicted nuclease of predicted toxin-antitoxin system